MKLKKRSPQKIFCKGRDGEMQCIGRDGETPCKGREERRRGALLHCKVREESHYLARIKLQAH